MMEKVLFYIPDARRFGNYIALEIIENQLRQKNEVTVLFCHAELATCERNPNHKISLCVLCRSFQPSLTKIVSEERAKFGRFYQLTPVQKRMVEEFKTVPFSSVEEAKNVKLEGSDIGKAAFNSAVFFYRELELNLTEHEDHIRRCLVTAATVHFSLKNYLTEEQPDALYVFNGRFAEYRPALRAAEALSIRTYVFEKSTILDGYTCLNSVYTLDIDYLKNEMESHYMKSDLPKEEKRRIALEWFEGRRFHSTEKIQGALVGKDQTMNLLPPHLKTSDVNVAIFVTSDYEFAGIDELDNPYYKDQNDGIYRTFCEFRGREDIRFYLRVHPNLGGMDNSQTRRYADYAREFKNVEVIDALSPVDTYALVDACDFVLVFGPTTVGIEAIYRKKPTILMGRALYEDLGGVIKPGSHNELVSILQNYIRNRTLPEVEIPEEAAIKFGFFYQTYCREFRYVKNADYLHKAFFVRDGKKYYLQRSLIGTFGHFIFRALGC